ncbi:MAG: c-type cytochrome domain-containing protein, partial [Pirellulaceae bacterium]
MWIQIVLTTTVLICSANRLLAYQQPPVDFQKEVRPILANHCFACHGFDDKSRQADLRLDLPSDPVDPNRAAPTIVPGRPEASEMIRRILSEDPDEIMPPPATKKPLSATQKAVLEQWIAQGARYEKHWAFAPLRRPTPPEFADSTNSSTNRLASNPIDRWIRSELAQRKLEPAPQSDTVTLVRRLYLDLIG